MIAPTPTARRAAAKVLRGRAIWNLNEVEDMRAIDERRFQYSIGRLTEEAGSLRAVADDLEAIATEQERLAETEGRNG